MPVFATTWWMTPAYKSQRGRDNAFKPYPAGAYGYALPRKLASLLTHGSVRDEIILAADINGSTSEDADMGFWLGRVAEKEGVQLDMVTVRLGEGISDPEEPQPESPRIFLGVLSTPSERDKRDNFRRRCAEMPAFKDAASSGLLRYRFIVGEPESKEEVGWFFQHKQGAIYSNATRKAALGLLAEQREHGDLELVTGGDHSATKFGRCSICSRWGARLRRLLGLTHGRRISL